MVNTIVFILGFIFFYCIFLWLDKRKQKLKEKELNAVIKRRINREPKIRSAVDGQSFQHMDDGPLVYRYIGEFKPGVIYKDGDVIFKNGDYYVSIKGRLEHLGGI